LLLLGRLIGLLNALQGQLSGASGLIRAPPLTAPG
jgi:hypothetical protein